MQVTDLEFPCAVLVFIFNISKLVLLDGRTWRLMMMVGIHDVNCMRTRPWELFQATSRINIPFFCSLPAIFKGRQYKLHFYTVDSHHLQRKVSLKKLI
jgi:hypothetical protein